MSAIRGAQGSGSEPYKRTVNLTLTAVATKKCAIYGGLSKSTKHSSARNFRADALYY